MSFLRRIWNRDEGPVPAACTALDIGTEFAKALVFEIDEAGHGTVRGVGRKRQGLSHMQSGTVADIAAVVDNCAVALQEAEEMAGFRPTQVVIGIAGELVKGFTTTLTQERKKPETPINDAELVKLIDSVQREALKEAERSITWETGLPHVDVRLVHSAIVGASIDGYGLTNPVGFQGRHIKIGIFNAFAPLVHLGALQSVASQLDLELLEIVAEPYAVARVLGAEHVRQAGALFVDVGGGTTDVALVRQGGIEGTRMFALGGRAFTKSIADRLDLPFPRAESLKVDYARGLAIAEHDAVGEIVRDDVAVWAAGVELVMEELAAGEMLPSRIHLCGGGSRLPEIREALAAERFWKRLPFARPPEVAIMAPDQVEAISDATELLVDQQDVTPLGLAWQAIEIQTSEDPARRRAAPRPAGDEGLGGRRGHDRLPGRRGRDHLGRRRGSARRPTRGSALVIPFGSRVATSRINFRLLAREAMVNGRRLDIVAPDASARALAASAGLPVFGSVGEYEAALDAPVQPDEPRRADAAAPRRRRRGDSPPRRPRPPPTGRDRRDRRDMPSAASPSPPAQVPMPAPPRPARPSSRRSCTAGREVPVAQAAPPARPRRAHRRDPGARPRARRRRRRRLPRSCPSAEITVTPQIRTVGPIDVTVRADPAATAVDEAAGVIPAQTVDDPGRGQRRVRGDRQARR